MNRTQAELLPESEGPDFSCGAAEHVLEAELRMLERQMRTGFANTIEQLTASFSNFEVAQAKSNQRLAGIILGGIAIATTTIVAVLA